MKLIVFCTYLFKDLFFDRGRALLTVVSLTAVIVSTLATSATAEVLMEFSNQPEAVANNLLIMSEFALEPMQSNLDDSLLQSAAEAVRQEFGPDSVRSASPVIYRSLRFDNKRLQILAVPLDDMIQVHNLELLEGQWPVSDDQVVDTQEAMQLLNWKTGDSLEIRDTKLIIVGRVNQAGARMAAIWMDFSSGRELFNAENNFQIGFLQINNQNNLSAVQAYLEEDAHMPAGYVVYLEQQLYERYYLFVADLLKVAFILTGLALGVVCFGTYNTTGLTLMERGRDIAILRTLGFSSHIVRLFILGRTLLQTLTAFLLAWGVMAVVVIINAHSPIAIEAKMGILRLSPENLGLGLVLTLFSASLGAWLISRAQNSRNLADQLRE